jgi:hypothetical protein
VTVQHAATPQEENAMSKPQDVQVVLLDEDDFMHPVEDVGNFNESAYYNFFDADEAVGGWVRVGNRVNEGYAEVSVCLYEPDGTGCFQYRRPQIESNDAHSAGGLSFEVVKPFEEHRVTYDGNVCFLRDPLEMDNPSKAFKQNPQVPVELELDWHGRSPGWGGEPRRRADDGSWEPARLGDASKQFARGHFEQHGAVEGSLSIDGRKYDLKGHGLRDHSWGPRFWQNTGYYRWLTITLGEDFGMMGVVSEVLGESDQKESSNGYVYRKGEPNKRIVKVDLETEFGGEQNVHRSIKAQLHAEDGELFDVQGKVLSLVPCRNRRDGWVTRISEGMTEWRCGEHVGHGMSEYLDHLVKGE